MADPKSAGRERTLSFIVRSHFIHNLLNALVALNLRGDRARLGEAFFRLGGLFRYVGQEGDSVRLSEELRFVEDYLALQGIRFEERLSYRILADAAAETTIVPRFSLFPEVQAVLERSLESDAASWEILVDCRTGSPSPRDLGVRALRKRALRRCGSR